MINFLNRRVVKSTSSAGGHIFYDLVEFTKKDKSKLDFAKARTFRLYNPLDSYIFLLLGPSTLALYQEFIQFSEKYEKDLY